MFVFVFDIRSLREEEQRLRNLRLPTFQRQLLKLINNQKMRCIKLQKSPYTVPLSPFFGTLQVEFEIYARVKKR